MSIRALLYSQLTANSGLSALIGSRLYPVKFPQGVTFPCVTYQRVTEPALYAFASGVKVWEAHYQFSCFALDSDTAESVATALKSAVETLVSGSGTTLHEARTEGTVDLYEPDQQVFHQAVEVLCLYE